jgi:hypothetical protein
VAKRLFCGIFIFFYTFVLMDSFQFWLYVIIAVIYAISRMRKKQREAQPKAPDREPVQRRERAAEPRERPVPKTLTFEDLLREITEGKAQQRGEPVVDYDDNIPEEEQDLEDVEYDYRKEDKTFETYEEAKRMAFERPSLEETMKVEDTVVSFGKFKEFELKKHRNLAKEYLQDFGDPAGIRKAIVMSEILKPKF